MEKLWVSQADLVGPGNEEEVMDVVSNVRKPLKLGYVIVKVQQLSMYSLNTAMPKAFIY
jgi:hypothetical protein